MRLVWVLKTDTISRYVHIPLREARIQKRKLMAGTKNVGKEGEEGWLKNLF